MTKKIFSLFLGFVLLLSTALDGLAQQGGELPAPSGIRLLQSGPSGASLDLSVPAYQLNASGLPGQGTQDLEVPGASYTAEPGLPRLPVVSAMLGVPAGAQVELKIVGDQAELLPGTYQLENAPQSARLSEDFQPGQYEDPASAGSPALSSQPVVDEYLPQAPAQVADDFWFRDQRIIRVSFYPFQYNPAKGALLWHRDLQVELSFQGDVSAGQGSAAGDENPFEPVLRSMLLNYEDARSFRGEPAASPQSPAAVAAQSLGPRYKIVVDHDGIYRLTYDVLKTAGMDVDKVDPRTFRLSSQGQDIAIAVAGESDGKFNPGDTLIFYGQKFYGDRLAARYASQDDHWPNFGSWQPHLNAEMFEKYTDENVYWLMVGGTPGPRMGTANGVPHNTAPVPAYFYTTVHQEESHEWWTWHFTSEDTWFWERVQNGGADSITRNYAVPVTSLASGVLTATVRAEVVARSYNNAANPDHHTRFTINQFATALDDAQWDGPSRHTFTSQVPISALQEGQNQLHFTVYKTPAIYSDDMYFNWFEVEYPRRFLAAADQLSFSRAESGKPWQYEIGNFSTNQVAVYDISDPAHPIQVLNPQVSAASGKYKVAFEASHASQAGYFAVGSAGVQSPKSVTFYSPPDLYSTSNRADMIFITHHDFLAAIQTLADYRASQGMRTKVVDVQDLYNEFNDGIYNPIAIKTFLAYAYANWRKPAPAYVLLVGGGHWNFKGYTGNTNPYGSDPIHMPPNLVWVDPWQGEVDSASLLANIAGDDIFPDLAIGRLPVDNLNQLSAAISKIMAYEHSTPQPWQNHLLFIADNVPDLNGAGDFVAMSDSVINAHVTPAYRPDRLYLNDYGCTPSYQTGSCPQVTSAIANSLNITGTLFVNYIGHGADERWAHEGVLRTTAAGGDKDNPQLNNLLMLNNRGQLPVVLSMTCLDGYWIYPLPNKISLAAELVSSADNGAVSAFSPTGLGVATGHDVLNRSFYDAVFQDGVQDLGAASLAAKLALYNTGHNYDLIDTFTIFGDPALRLLTTVVPAMANRGVFPGHTLTYTLQLANTSAQADTLQLSPGGNAWPVSFSQTSFPLQPGERATVQVSVSVPANAPSGQLDTVNVSVTSQNQGARIATATLVTTARHTFLYLPQISK